jgi:hypothetical protein
MTSPCCLSVCVSPQTFLGEGFEAYDITLLFVCLCGLPNLFGFYAVHVVSRENE